MTRRLRASATHRLRASARLRFFATLLFAGAAPGVAAEPIAPELPTAPIAAVGWLSGCWEARSSRRLVEERWMEPRGATMLGMSRTVRGDTLVEYEFLFLSEKKGSLSYEARPSGQHSAAFVATAVSDTSIIFENPHHDFPQKISYMLLRPDSLIARVEGTIEGRHRALDFPYRRVGCERR